MKKIISISISQELFEKIKEKAKSLGLSISACITLLLQGEIKLWIVFMASEIY